MRHMLSTVLGREGFQVATADDAEAALRLSAEDPFDVVLTDVRMPGAVDGIGLVEKLRDAGRAPTVIVMSAYGSRDLAIEAIRRGAYNYVSKPFTADDILLAVAMAVERERFRSENRLLKQALHVESAPGSMVGKSPAMQAVYTMIRKVAAVPSTVLITGESGTGKELVARAIHVESPRKDKPFVAVNCGAIPETLIESELFGHARGAFTGAATAKKGLVEEAAGGTLFLDEIGELPAPMQVKLLRLLQESEVRRVGENRSIKVDVRIVAATARDLPAEIAAGNFREDLWFRLNVLQVQLPPLRERREDIPMLVEHFLHRLAARMGAPAKDVTPEAMQKLIEYSWTGNVRELENTMERAVVLATGGALDVGDLPEKIRGGGVRPAAGDPLLEMIGGALGEGLSVKKAGAWMERELIRRALERTKGNRTQAAELLELSPRALLYKIRDYGLE
ncbi:MAG TPA: sigma-54 dependent transcriptional regulator [bacterium]|nr:sigma-54 dependent transcriptional regulator [bacterium]